jgi:hypothetical protein
MVQIRHTQSQSLIMFLDNVLETLRKAGVAIQPLPTKVKGPDVWFECPDDQANLMQSILTHIENMGEARQDYDPEYGEHLFISMRVDPPIIDL